MKSLVLLLLIVAFVFPAMPTRADTHDSSDVPVSGTKDSAEFDSLELGILALMRKYHIPGGQLAVMREGRLVYSRAFGYADTEESVPVTNTNLFRIASCSKVFTAAAIWRLIEQGKLSPESKAFEILADIQPVSGHKDDRLQQITVLQLLEHSAGFSISKGDPQKEYLRIGATVQGDKPPATATQLVQYRIGLPLDFDPGTKHVYSNFGYNVLGHVIEHVSKMSYQQYVRDELLAPIGITDMVPGKTREVDRAPNEVHYYTDEGGWSVLPEEPLPVTLSYGADFWLESWTAHGGWLATAEDLARFAAAIDGYTSTGYSLLKPETRERMLMGNPQFVTPDGAVQAAGPLIKEHPHRWLHSGALAGTSSTMYGGIVGGTTIGVNFNSLPMQKLVPFFTDLDKQVVKAIRRIRH